MQYEIEDNTANRVFAKVALLLRHSVEADPRSEVLIQRFTNRTPHRVEVRHQQSHTLLHQLEVRSVSVVWSLFQFCINGIASAAISGDITSTIG